MKRILLCLLCLTLLLCVTGCSAGFESDVDLDLAAMSGTVVYSEVLNMLMEPEAYDGMTVRMSGSFNVINIPSTGARYFTCLIADATACCKQGMEFTLKDPRVFPDEYPELGAPIQVVGTFEVYEEDGMQYCRVADAKFESKEAAAP